MFLISKTMTQNAKQDLMQRIEDGSGFTADNDEIAQYSTDGILRCYEETTSYLL